MARITVEEVIEATGGKLLSENSKTFNGVSIDSRTIEEGDLFFAIQGERFDGHDYLERALVKGSGAVVAARPDSLPEGRVIVCVEDTLRSLQDMAHFLRTKRDIPVVAVTGSNGKTTTKEMIHLILSRKFRTLKNEGNLNNLIGLPLSLLRLHPDDEIAVFEMGMNASGEIRRLCEIAEPSHGVITNIGSAHVGMLGGYDAVRKAKMEILEGLNIAVVNADDEYLMQGIGELTDFKGRFVTFSIENASQVSAGDVRITENGSEFTLSIRDEGSASVTLNVHGLFNVYNALAASAVSYSLGMSIDEIRTALNEYRAFSMRFELVNKGGIRVINDSYNANPSSMRESIGELHRLGGEGRIVAILGDMRELGQFSDDEHKGVGRMISETGVDVFVAVGEKMSLAAEECVRLMGEVPGVTVYTFSDAVETKENVKDILKRGDTVLIKGSRAMEMERVMEALQDAL